MAMESYTQCRMERANRDGSKSIHTAFIPTSFAKIGKHVEFLADSDDDEGTWSKGWVVIERGATVDRSVVDSQRSARNAFAEKLERKHRR